MRARVIVVAAAVAVSACSGTSSSTTEQGGASSLDDVRPAVVRIVAEGTFVDPEAGEMLNAAGVGSGFIIDPSGIAVTNNHVVTGGAFLEVSVEGEDDPRNARVLGVSECSDLAVIDIDGDGFATLDWADEPPTTGLDIYVAGYPLGTEEYTLLDGIVSKEDADGETSWASVDEVIEHSADTLPGTSGGPVVTAGGAVVGVNYAGDDSGQSFAISAAEAREIVDELRAGNDVTSIGVNGTAFVGEGLSGIWVSSVESGSPAAEAGIRAGDVITRLENLVMATDGTMADYCDILRSHLPEDPLAVEVFRPETGETLEGTLNGSPLEVSFSFEQEIEEAEGSGPTSYDGYTTVTDDTGSISVDVPTAWAEVDGSAWVMGGSPVGVAITAAPSIEGFESTWTTPGMFFGASRDMIATYDEESILDGIDFSDTCEYDSRSEYADPLYTGFYDLWTGCGGTGTMLVVLAAVPPDRSFLLLVEVQVVSEADVEALDTVLNTFVASESF